MILIYLENYEKKTNLQAIKIMVIIMMVVKIIKIHALGMGNISVSSLRVLPFSLKRNSMEYYLNF
jgi:hypothetical protein